MMSRYASILTSHCAGQAMPAYWIVVSLKSWRKYLSAWDQITPLGFTQEFETQLSLSDKALFVEGCWHCCFSFRVEASQRMLQEELWSLHLRF